MRAAFQSLAAILGILLVFIYALGAGLWTNTGDNWYRGLNSPSWQPPDFVFGLIWLYNFIVLGFAAVTVANKLSNIKIIIYLVIFLISVIFALIWAYQFYRPHNLELASLALAGTAITTLPMMYLIYQASVPVFFAVMPYQIWVIIASLLSANYAKLN